MRANIDSETLLQETSPWQVNECLQVSDKLSTLSHVNRAFQMLAIHNARYINTLTWLQGVQDSLLYLVLFSLYPSLLLELREKKKLRKITTLTRKPRRDVRILIYQTWPICSIMTKNVTGFLNLYKNPTTALSQVTSANIPLIL